MIRALGPAIAARRSVLEVLCFWIATYNKHNIYGRDKESSDYCAFFAAVLSARKLKYLKITLFWSWNVACSLLDADETNADYDDSRMMEL